MPENTLAELFAKDPLSYTEQDLDRIITELQEKRRLFAATGKSTTATRVPIDLKELGFE